VRLLCLVAALGVAALGAGCATARGPGPVEEPAARAALERFTAAAQAGRWDEAWPLLSARWRARATPALLALDWKGSGPVGPEAVERVRRLLAAGERLRVSGAEATLAVGEGRAARLRREEAGWRVDALE
jgi:hypothetical protein